MERLVARSLLVLCIGLFIFSTCRAQEASLERAINSLHRASSMLKVMTRQDPASLIYHCNRGANHWRLRFRNEDDAAAFQEETGESGMNWAQALETERAIIDEERGHIHDALERGAASDAAHALIDLTGRIQRDTGQATERREEQAVEAVTTLVATALEHVMTLEARLREHDAEERAAAGEEGASTGLIQEATANNPLEAAGTGSSLIEATGNGTSLLGTEVEAPVETAQTPVQSFSSLYAQVEESAQAADDDDDGDDEDGAEVEDTPQLRMAKEEMVKYLMAKYGCSEKKARWLTDQMAQNHYYAPYYQRLLKKKKRSV